MDEQKNNNVTMTDVLAIMEKMNQQNREAMLEFAKELKKPTEREQAKIDAEEKKIQQQQMMRLKVGQAEQHRKDSLARSCQHSSYNSATGIRKHAWRAQVSTPAGEKPYFQPICSQCLMLGPKILATPEQLQNGVNLDQYDGIDLERLNAWAKASHQQVA